MQSVGHQYRHDRRHMTAAQRAMATAMIYPEPEKGGRGTARRASSALKVWSPKGLGCVITC